MLSVAWCLATVDGVRGIPPRAAKEGSGGSSGLEWPRVWVGEESAVHRVCAGEGTPHASAGLSASPSCNKADGGDEGRVGEDVVIRRACIQHLTPRPVFLDGKTRTFHDLNLASEAMVARSREHEALSPPDASNAYGGCEESV